MTLPRVGFLTGGSDEYEDFASRVHLLNLAERLEGAEMFCDLAERAHRGEPITIGETTIEPTPQLAEHYLRLAEILASEVGNG